MLRNAGPDRTLAASAREADAQEGSADSRPWAAALRRVVDAPAHTTPHRVRRQPGCAIVERTTACFGHSPTQGRYRPAVTQNRGSESRREPGTAPSDVRVRKRSTRLSEEMR